MFPVHRCVEVHVTASAASLQSRDPKGLYARDLATGTVGLSGLNSPYEVPVDPALRLDTDQCTSEDAVQQVLALIQTRVPLRR
jgi:adenylylsulfate kinase-like enzyme